MARHRQHPVGLVCAFVSLVGLALALGTVRPAEAMLEMDVWDAIDHISRGGGSAGDDALVFMFNDDINRARMSGYLNDHQYQMAQRRFANVNEGIARQAATESGVGFTKQTATSKRFAPGTDSDYIMTVKSKNPVGDIRKTQGRYNELVNKYLKENLKRGTRFEPRMNWHNKLDVDFMADPEYVTDKQFKQISKLNNDAYTRQNAAEYERLSRMKGGAARLTPAQYRDYGLEMQDFIAKKQKYLERVRRNPAMARGPHARAEFQRLMAQEQKYIDRIRSTDTTLRKQAGLKPRFSAQNGPFYETHINKQGKLVIRKHGPPLSKLGARRSPANLIPTSNASAVAKNSLNRAVRELSESMAQAHAIDPKKWSAVADDIAQLSRGLPPGEKGMLIERIKQQRGGDFASKVAKRMRAQPRLSNVARLRTSLQKALSADDVANLRAMRDAVGKTANQALKALGKIAIGFEIYTAASNMKTFWTSMNKAMDPDLTDAEADKYFAQAFDASRTLAMSGAMGAVFTAAPALGGAYMAWVLATDGKNWFLHNTETGMWINRKYEDYAGRYEDARLRASDRLSELMGGESLATRSDAELRRLEQTYWKALKDGRIQLKQGYTTKDIAELLRSGQLLAAGDLIQKVGRSKPGPSEAGAEVWRLVGKPEIYTSPSIDNWKPGMTARKTVENKVSAGSFKHASSYLRVDPKTGDRIPDKGYDKKHAGQVTVSGPPTFLIAGQPMKMGLAAAIKQLMGKSRGSSIQGSVMGSGVQIQSDSDLRGLTYAMFGRKEQMSVTYELSVKRSSSNIKKLVVKVPGVGQLTWTYHAAIGVSAEDAMEQLAREAGAKPDSTPRPGGPDRRPGGTPDAGARPDPGGAAAHTESLVVLKSLLALRELIHGSDKRPAQSVTAVAAGHGEWVAVRAEQSRALAEQFIHDRELAEVKRGAAELTRQGYFVSDIDYQGGQWAAVLTKGAGTRPQKIVRSRGTKAAAARVKELGKEGYRVTSATRGPEDWVLVFTKDGPLGTQSVKWTRSWSDMKAWIAERGRAGRAITSMVQANGMWMGVASTNSGITHQRWFNRSTAADLSSSLDAVATDGLRATDVTAAPDGWLAIVSRRR